MSGPSPGTISEPHATISALQPTIKAVGACFSHLDLHISAFHACIKAPDPSVQTLGARSSALHGVVKESVVTIS